MRIISAIPISAIMLSTFAFVIQEGYCKEEPTASGIRHLFTQDEEHQRRHLNQDVAFSSSLSMISSGELAYLSLDGSLSFLMAVMEDKTKASKEPKASKKPKASKTGSISTRRGL
ncbi:hypothetical protein ACHAXA_004466 [Cyclostephanos tholiformis]|uniref:Uncharacterized protein n=1 Tax=Cyclostephanos tholiformis TaxID=382380 RepID=A0ABD3RAH9_9STRA